MGLPNIIGSYLVSGELALFPAPFLSPYKGSGSNPVFSLNNFAAFFPRFLGAPLTLGSPVFTAGSAVVPLNGATGVIPGALVASPALPDGVGVVSYDGTTLTLSAPATTSGPAIAAAFPAPLVPLVALDQYLFMATNSLSFLQWAQNWPYGVSLYVAHYAQLYAQTESPSAGPLSGLAQGINTSQSAGPVSVGLQPLMNSESAGTWALTQYGLQLLTLARTVGMGPIYAG